MSTYWRADALYGPAHLRDNDSAQERKPTPGLGFRLNRSSPPGIVPSTISKPQEATFMAQVESPPTGGDVDPDETAEWLDSLQYTLETKGPERVNYLLSVLGKTAY